MLVEIPIQSDYVTQGSIGGEGEVELLKKVKFNLNTISIFVAVPVC